MQNYRAPPDPALQAAYEAGQREARNHYTPVPQEYLYVQQPGPMPGGKVVRSKSIVVNLPTVVTIVFFAVTTTIGGAFAWSSITYAIERLGDKVGTLVTRVERVETRQVAYQERMEPKSRTVRAGPPSYAPLAWQPTEIR